MNRSNKILFIIQSVTCVALGVSYILMPSNEDKLKWLQKNSRFTEPSKSYRPEVAQQVKEEAERSRQFLDAIKRAQTSDSLPLGRKND